MDSRGGFGKPFSAERRQASHRKRCGKQRRNSACGHLRVRVRIPPGSPLIKIFFRCREEYPGVPAILALHTIEQRAFPVGVTRRVMGNVPALALRANLIHSYSGGISTRIMSAPLDFMEISFSPRIFAESFSPIFFPFNSISPEMTKR